MLPIEQGNENNGCALAAIASVTEHGYTQARLMLKRKKFDGRSKFDPSDGVTFQGIRKCLKKLGKKPLPSIYVAKRNRHASWFKEYLLRQKKVCIICLDYGMRNSFHCVVWNPAIGMIWDPGCNAYSDLFQVRYWPSEVFRIIPVRTR
jgi:hypothetical protein